MYPQPSRNAVDSKGVGHRPWLAGVHEQRSERLVELGRLALAASSLVALYLDPSEPARYAGLSYGLSVAYLAYAAAVAGLAYVQNASGAAFRLITHGIDLLVFSVLTFFTEGARSPFFLYFAFAVVVASLRWQWRGTFFTTAIALTAFIVIGFSGTETLRDPQFELNTFMFRSALLAVLAVMVGYLRAHELRGRQELARLAVWPRTMSGDLEPFARELLQQVTSVLDAPRALLVWDDPDEPWVHIALYAAGGVELWRDPPAEAGAVVAHALEEDDFLCPDAGARAPVVLHTFTHGLGRWHGIPLASQFRERFDIGPVLSWRLVGDVVSGRLLCLDKRRANSDDLVLGTIVARQCTTRLDHFYLSQQVRQAAMLGERLRVARDLHDSLLQLVLAAQWQIENIQATAAEAMQESITRLQFSLDTIRRELRAFIDGLRYDVTRSNDLVELARDLELVWAWILRESGLAVEHVLDPPAMSVPQETARHVLLLIREALVNVVRHARASRARVEVRARDDALVLVVTDDGRGFPFRSRLSDADLVAHDVGPRSIRERVASLGGSLTVSSADDGSRLDIRLPMPRRIL